MAVPVPILNASVTSIVRSNSANGASVGLSAVSVIRPHKILSHSMVHSHLSDEWAKKVCARVTKLGMNREQVVQTFHKGT